ncbi:hypothetical protein [Peribacillus asahii]|uniref:Uncharacterized protein n=1 Tax=Peribacillus asahii TaxID=228899 RepID=A0A3Q9RKP7_9BACI|nr:hypothetical protein [Peribacillus asahii]AZV41724.1 hypothetical protein BAOM_1113 [Peribacillus asahii]USK86070.1 hypothetical protein LIT35_05345 [Peribacillus asahii]
MGKKKKCFNKNSIPFWLLAVIHLGMFLLVLKRKKQKDTWILLLSNMGFAYLFEYLVLNLFHGYRYKPSIMKKRAFDSVLGAIFSQAIYVPITATFLTLLNKNWKWKISFSLFYYCIENLFLRLNIYKVYWWRPIYTVVLLNVYFNISDAFYKALSTQKRWAMVIAHYLAIQVVWSTLLYVSAVKRYIRFGRGYFHTWTEHFKIVPLYSLILSFIAAITSSKAGLFYRMPLPLSHIIIDITLVKMGILKVNINRFLVTCFRYLPMTFISRFFYKTIYKE